MGVVYCSAMCVPATRWARITHTGKPRHGSSVLSCGRGEVFLRAQHVEDSFAFAVTYALQER